MNQRCSKDAPVRKNTHHHKIHWDEQLYGKRTDDTQEFLQVQREQQTNMNYDPFQQPLPTLQTTNLSSLLPQMIRR